jgi:transglutaminase-like putative cysteine protease
MNFEKFFRLVSYSAVFCGFLALWVSGTFGIVSTVLFVALMVAAWRLEETRWQISERLGTVLIVLAMPAFFLAWRFQIITFGGSEAAVAGVLARMILSLAGVKLLQKKSDRDWIFLYLMAFFEVLLAAGLSISGLYLLSFLAYLLVMVSAIIAFEIRKTSHAVEKKISGDKTHERDPNSEAHTALPVRRLPATAVTLIVFIVVMAIPLFFVLPRVGGAGFGGNPLGQKTFSGFSDSVHLGGIGEIQQSNEVVMRVHLEGDSENLYFRGVALDTFDNKTWSKSKTGNKIAFESGEGEPVQVDFSGTGENRTVQTIYLEPLDTPVLFALARPIAVQGNFPAVFRDAYGSLSLLRSFERVSYKVVSDRSLPQPAQLQADNKPYVADVRNYLSLPLVLDPRIGELAQKIAAPAKTRYDKARAIESWLQNSLGYTLEQKASGDEPLADFLFNVREGHCEYFATAMAIMLRTQGIASRIVNGFHGGEYNDAADVTVVRQRNAHTWVEVYFPGEDAWVPFDPTPFAGQPATTTPAGIAGSIHKYLEALETFWVQHFVAYDDQEQRTLARSMRNGLVEYQAGISAYLTHTQRVMGEWWADVRGEKGVRSSLAAIGTAAAYVIAAALGILLLIWFHRKLKAFRVFQRIWNRFFKKQHASIVEFYERLQRIMSEGGLKREPHQTPLEFAFSSGIPEAVSITERYNRVRFGAKELSRHEADEIESWLERLQISIQPRIVGK